MDSGGVGTFPVRPAHLNSVRYAKKLDEPDLFYASMVCMRLAVLVILFLSTICRGHAMEPGSSAAKSFRRTTFWFVDVGMSEAEVDARAEALAASGIDGVIMGGGRHHYLFDDLPYIEDYVRAAKKVVDSCHKRGIQVAEHHSAVLTTRRNYAAEHSAWLQRDFTTEEASVWPEYGTWAFCPNNADFREHYWQIASDLLRKTGADALMSDDTVFHHGCCCDSCSRRWSIEVGGDIRDAYKAARVQGTCEWRQFNETRRRWYADFRQWLRQRQAEQFPGTACISLVGSIASAWGTQNHGGSVEGGLDTSDVAVWEIYNPADFYSWRRIAAEAEFLSEACRVRHVVPLCLPYADTAESRDLFDPEEETFMWALARACGMPFALARVYLTGLTADDTQRGFFVFERDRLGPYLDCEPAAAIGLFFSRRSRDVDPRWEDSHSRPAIAWAEALTDNLVPHRAITEETLDVGLPTDLRTLILPNVFAIADRHLDAVERFVREGGTVVASFMTGTQDEWGEPAIDRRRERLKRLLGVEFRSQNSVEDSASELPRADAEAEGLQPLKSPIEAYRHTFGKGQVIYLPVLTELLAFQDWVNERGRYTDARDPAVTAALARLVRDLTPDQPVKIRSSQPGLHLLTTVWRSGHRLLVYIVNCSGADLKPGRRIPRPSKVTWGPRVTLTVKLPTDVRSAELISLDKNENWRIDRPGRSFQVNSPRRCGLLVINLRTS